MSSLYVAKNASKLGSADIFVVVGIKIRVGKKKKPLRFHFKIVNASEILLDFSLLPFTARSLTKHILFSIPPKSTAMFRSKPLVSFAPVVSRRLLSTEAPACSGNIPKITPRCGPALHHHNYTFNLRSYAEGSKIMDRVVRQFLDQKKNLDVPPTPPTLLTFQFNPVYTLGRREKGVLAEDPDFAQKLSKNGEAEVHQTFRGGQTTFHGPGQLVAYPIIDLRAFDSKSDADTTTKPHLPVRCYVSLLEKTLISLLHEQYGINARTTENTGVWADDDHKIAALGIHVRRHITSHGIALNVNTDLAWFDRIVACGLPDKKTTTIAQWTNTNDITVPVVADQFAAQLAANLGLQLHTEHKQS